MIRKTLIAAVTVLALAATACESAPVSASPKEAPKAAPVEAKRVDGKQVVEITVTEKGYEPSPVKVKAGEPVTLIITRKTEKTCAKELIIDGKVDVKLPMDTPVTATFTPDKAGEIKYGCAMNKMIAGYLTVE